MRYLLASVPYRKKLNFTFDGLKAAATAIERLRNFKLRLETDKFPDGDDEEIANRTRTAKRRFEESLDDDLNTAEALAAMFEYVRDANTAMDADEFRAGNVPALLEFLDEFDSIFDVLRPSQERRRDVRCRRGTPDRRARRRQEEPRLRALRSNPGSSCSDAGIILEDTKEGTRWKRK